MCAKQPTSYLLILLIYPSLIFSSISPTFFVTEFPTPIFFLSCFSLFLLFISVPTGKLLVNLGGVLSNCGSDYRECCQTVFSIPSKDRSPKQITQAVRTNNSSLSESYRTSSRDPHAMTSQLQSHLLPVHKKNTSDNCIF